MGIAGAVAVGATLPLMTVVFGSSTTSFNNQAVGQGTANQFQDSINRQVLYFVYLFVGRFVIGYIATLCLCVAAARTTNSLRKAFLESLLRKEIYHFDLQGNGSAATQVTTSMGFSMALSALLNLYQTATASTKVSPRSYSRSSWVSRFFSRRTSLRLPFNGSLLSSR